REERIRPWDSTWSLLRGRTRRDDRLVFQEPRLVGKAALDATRPHYDRKRQGRVPLTSQSPEEESAGNTIYRGTTRGFCDPRARCNGAYFHSHIRDDAVRLSRSGPLPLAWRRDANVDAARLEEPPAAWEPDASERSRS